MASDPLTLAREEQDRRGEMNAARDAVDRARDAVDRARAARDAAEAALAAAENELAAAENELSQAEHVAARARSRYRALGEQFAAYLDKHAPPASEPANANGTGGQSTRFDQVSPEWAAAAAEQLDASGPSTEPFT